MRRKIRKFGILLNPSSPSLPLKSGVDADLKSTSISLLKNVYLQIGSGFVYGLSPYALTPIHSQRRLEVKAWHTCIPAGGFLP
ncbi:hypothetical protein V1281_004746 [Nitrobacteraceae bacterium AZCC 2161]